MDLTEPRMTSCILRSHRSDDVYLTEPRITYPVLDGALDDAPDGALEDLYHRCYLPDGPLTDLHLTETWILR